MHAQGYPAKPVRLIVATSPGSQPDGISRLLAQKLSEAWGKPVVIDNRNGAGGLVALAVTSPQRAPVLPDVPALAETMPEFRRPETSHAVVAPAGTPRAIVRAINRDVAKALELPDVKERLQGIAFVTAPTAPEECDRILRTQIETLATVVRDAGLRPK